MPRGGGQQWASDSGPPESVENFPGLPPRPFQGFLWPSPSPGSMQGGGQDGRALCSRGRRGTCHSWVKATPGSRDSFLSLSEVGGEGPCCPL